MSKSARQSRKFSRSQRKQRTQRTQRKQRKSQRSQRKQRKSQRRSRGGAALSGAPLSFSLSGDWSSKMSQGQGGDYLKYHVGQHGGATGCWPCLGMGEGTCAWESRGRCLVCPSCSFLISAKALFLEWPVWTNKLEDENAVHKDIPMLHISLSAIYANQSFKGYTNKPSCV